MHETDPFTMLAMIAASLFVVAGIPMGAFFIGEAIRNALYNRKRKGPPT